MISRIAGLLLERELDRVEVMTSGGVGYEIFVPRTVFERLPAQGQPVELLTFQMVREDAVQLFGFLDPMERAVFGRLLSASGVGPRLALALLSALPAPRLVRAIRDRDIPALTAVSGVGKKTAERLALDLGSKLDDLPMTTAAGPTGGPGVQEAVRALAVLGFSAGQAEDAVREVLQEQGPLPSQELIRQALARMK